jgi:hypothetical protein
MWQPHARIIHPPLSFHGRIGKTKNENKKMRQIIGAKIDINNDSMT